jgi:hypothetical protein
MRWRRPNGTIPSPQTSRPPNTTAMDAVTNERVMVKPAVLPPGCCPDLIEQAG